MDLLFILFKVSRTDFYCEAAFSVRTTCFSNVPMAIFFFSGMLAVALDDFTINIFDMEMKRIVRRFSGQRGQINDMVRVFSPFVSHVMSFRLFF